MPIQQMLLGVGAAEKIYVDQVFESFVRVGDGGNKTITNKLDLSTEGGIVWVKERNGSNSHTIFSTDIPDVSGKRPYLSSNTDFETKTKSNIDIQFNSTGYQIQGNDGQINQASGNKYNDFAFRKAPGFFDTVTYTGNGSNRQISHNLGCVPGCVIVKRTSGTGRWAMYHRGVDKGIRPEESYIRLDNGNVESGGLNYWNGTKPTSSVFHVGTSSHVNQSGASYIAYLFAGGESSEETARSVAFDGSNDYMTSTSSDYSPGTGDFTMEAWVNIRAMSGGNQTNGIYQLSSTSGAFTYGGIALLYKNSSSENRWELYGGNSTNQSESNSYTGYAFGDWVHTAIVKTSNTIKLYIDGEERISAADTQNYSGYQYLGLGSAFATNHSFNGSISNFKLTIGQALYTSSFTPTNQPLTTTSQGSTASNVKALCCNNVSITGNTVIGGTLQYNGGVYSRGSNPFIDADSQVFGGGSEIIKCGSYIGNGKNIDFGNNPKDYGLYVDLGWEPQFLMLKRSDGSTSWKMVNCMTGLNVVSGETLTPNGSSQGANEERVWSEPTGFRLIDSSSQWNYNTGNFVYIAIRRADGHVGTPAELGTDVFAMDTGNDSSTIPCFDSNFAVDLGIYREFASTDDWQTTSRLTGTKYLKTNDSSAESTQANNVFDSNVGFAKSQDSLRQAWMWKRHAGFDVVPYYGDGIRGRKIAHQLGQPPQMIWIKLRSGNQGWCVYHESQGSTKYALLNSDPAFTASITRFNNTSPTATHFTVGEDNEVNGTDGSNRLDYIAVLFASVSGISKVGSYTGNSQGNTQTVGFLPKIVLVKRADGTGDWNLIWGFDTGVYTGSDLRIRLNKTNGRSNSDNWMSVNSTSFDPGNGDGSGLGNSIINANGVEYIYWAHA